MEGVSCNGICSTALHLYAILATYLEYKYQLLPDGWPVWLVTIGSLIFLALVTYAALLVGDTGMDILKSLRPLALVLSPRYTTALSKLQQHRHELVLQVANTVNNLGPQLYPDFRDISKETEDEHSENFSYRSRLKKGETQRTRSDSLASISSTTSDASHSLSRVNSESELGNIPLLLTLTTIILQRACQELERSLTLEQSLNLGMIMGTLLQLKEVYLKPKLVSE